MASHPNIDLIHGFFRAYSANNQQAIENILSPTIRWHIPGNHPLSGVKTGIAEVMNYFTQLGKAAFQASPIVMGVNEHYVIDCHHNWSTLTGELNFRAMSCLLWKIEDGKIVEVYNFPQDQHQTDAFFQTIYD